MKTKHTNLFLFFVSLLLATSCASTQKSTVFWVSGFKTTAASGAGKMEVLNVSRAENLDNPKWENFYAPIEGFQFEEGYMQKVKVLETALDKNQVPADASAITYKLVSVLEKQKDPRMDLGASWILATLNGSPINRMVAAPTLSIDIANMRVSGNNSCNNFNGKITALNFANIELGPLASTKKMCINKNIEPEFDAALNSVRRYEYKEAKLIFFDQTGKNILSFIKNDNPTANNMDKTDANNALSQVWDAVKINGKEIGSQGKIPQMEINAQTMKLNGNNGCNNYFGTIQSLETDKIKFAAIGSTKKMCPDMEIPSQFDQALNNTTSYKLDNHNLSFFDASGKEILYFVKKE